MKTAFVLLSLLVSCCALASPPPVSNANDDPLRLILSGTAEYQHRFGANMIETGGSAADGNRIRIDFQPTVAFLPSSITIDMNHVVTQADVQLLRLWVVNLLAYHRNTDASINHELEFLSASVPVWVTQLGETPSKIQTRIMVTVGAALGYRWMTDDRDGVVVDPAAAIQATSVILQRIFATAYVRSSATVFIGKEKEMNYLSGATGLQIGVGLTKNNMLRLVVNGALRYDGYNPDGKTVSAYLGAGIQWGAPQPMLLDDAGNSRR
jgi:hypothetical protein